MWLRKKVIKILVNYHLYLGSETGWEIGVLSGSETCEIQAVKFKQIKCGEEFRFIYVNMIKY